jgi:hypothetical protein
MMNTLLMPRDGWSITSLASNHARRYGLPCHIADNDLGGSTRKRRNSAPITIAGAFFVPALSCYGGLRRSTLGCVGFLFPRSANPVQFATLLCLAAGRGGSSEKGATPMKHAVIPSVIRAFAHRRMALSALRANSPLFVRLAQYNTHMAIVRTLETVGGAV